VRAFQECQNLPKRLYPLEFSLSPERSQDEVHNISPLELQSKLSNGDSPPLVVDVREPREYKQGHIPHAELIPLSKIMLEAPTIPHKREIVLVCRTGRRSARAAHLLQSKGFENICILEGGLLAWEAAGLLEAVEL